MLAVLYLSWFVAECYSRQHDDLHVFLGVDAAGIKSLDFVVQQYRDHYAELGRSFNHVAACVCVACNSCINSFHSYEIQTFRQQISSGSCRLLWRIYPVAGHGGVFTIILFDVYPQRISKDHVDRVVVLGFRRVWVRI